MTVRDCEAGVTLVEMLVALVLFALVGIASFVSLDAIIRTRDRTEGRLEQMARYDRALLLFTRDVIQSDPRTISVEDGRLSLSTPDGLSLTWDLQAAGVRRSAAQPGASPYITQLLLDQISALRFRVLRDDLTWSNVWPGAESETTLRAIEMTVSLGSAVGNLVRLAETTAPVPEPMSFDIDGGALSNLPPPNEGADVPAVREGN